MSWLPVPAAGPEDRPRVEPSTANPPGIKHQAARPARPALSSSLLLRRRCTDATAEHPPFGSAARPLANDQPARYDVRQNPSRLFSPPCPAQALNTPPAHVFAPPLRRSTRRRPLWQYSGAEHACPNPSSDHRAPTAALAPSAARRAPRARPQAISSRAGASSCPPSRPAPPARQQREQSRLEPAFRRLAFARQARPPRSRSDLSLSSASARLDPLRPALFSGDPPPPSLVPMPSLFGSPI